MNEQDLPLSLLSLRNLSLKLGRRPTAGILKRLKATVWGTPGAICYQHLDTEEKIQHLSDPWFLYLEKEAEVIGVLCLDRRQFSGIEAFYIRYFSFSEGMRRKGLDRKRVASPKSTGEGIFKRYSSQFFDSPKPLLEAAGIQQACFFAFVELDNVRSQEMVAQMGLQVCGSFQTRIFSRITPQLQTNVRRARPEEYAQILEMVASAYADHSFYTDHGLFYQENFFVLEENGQLIAGCQAQAVHWRVQDVPGMGGWLLMKLVPHIPGIGRLFQPNAFNFSAIEGLFCLPGHDAKLAQLLEGVLKLQGNHTAILWLSPISKILARLDAHVSWGILQGLKKNVEASVVMRGYDFPVELLEELRQKPIYVSAFDAT